MKIASVVGARPNFMKIAPLLHELRRVPPIEHVLIHSGQHYDDRLSAAFFRDLDLPDPDINLEVGSGSHAWQTGEIMQRLEPVLLECNPDLVVVVGDVNSTLATALTAAKLGLKLAHIEAGLRSFDARMPEEINRKLTDALADFLFVTEESGVQNLRNEGIPDERIFLVGNTMIDSLLQYRNLAAQSAILTELGLVADGSAPRPYAVLTLHRASNVDNPNTLRDILEAVATLAQELPVFFPAHPRVQERIEKFSCGHFLNRAGKANTENGLHWLEPLGYLDFLCLMDNSCLVLTDSGGIQEETTVLGVPCLTLRENTERPVTVEKGTNRVVGVNSESILRAGRHALSATHHAGNRPPLWDGQTAKRILDVLLEHLQTDLRPFLSDSRAQAESSSRRDAGG